MAFWFREAKRLLNRRRFERAHFTALSGEYRGADDELNRILKECAFREDQFREEDMTEEEKIAEQKKRREEARKDFERQKKSLVVAPRRKPPIKIKER